MTAGDFTSLATSITAVIGFAMAAGIGLWGLILGTRAGMKFFSRFTH